MNAHDEYVDDIAMLALGALGPEDAQRVRSHLSQCPACTKEYLRLREVADILPLAADADDAIVPGSAVRARVLAMAQRSREPRRFAPLPYLAAAACLAAAIIIGILYAQLSSRVGEQNAILADALSPSAQHFRVTGGEVLRNGRHLYIAIRNAPALPPGKVFQAWTLPVGSKRMAPSVTFVPHNGRVLLRLPENAQRVTAVAVSVEPPGGSPQPTSKPVFVVLLPASKA
ncbi:MAG TPA: anti-sigma factor [Candidatus Baltobacteraceae bacterium]|nr:anti-sigma factor [Candidatus Baltobacteraceae bacterium]